MNRQTIHTCIRRRRQMGRQIHRQTPSGRDQSSCIIYRRDGFSSALPVSTNQAFAIFSFQREDARYVVSTLLLPPLSIHIYIYIYLTLLALPPPRSQHYGKNYCPVSFITLFSLFFHSFSPLFSLFFFPLFFSHQKDTHTLPPSTCSPTARRYVTYSYHRVCPDAALFFYYNKIKTKKQIKKRKTTRNEAVG